MRSTQIADCYRDFQVFNPKLSEDLTRYWRLPKSSPAEQSLIIADVYFPAIQVPILALSSPPRHSHSTPSSTRRSSSSRR